jgi:hypothetical protein
MASINIPWKCLDLSYEPKNTTIDQPKTTSTPKTFAQALTNLCDIPLSQLPQPVEGAARVEYHKDWLGLGRKFSGLKLF